MLRIVCRRIASRGNALLSSKNFRFLSSNAESSGDSLPLGENEKNSSAIPMPGSEKLAVELPKSIFEIIEKTEIIEEKLTCDEYIKTTAFYVRYKEEEEIMKNNPGFVDLPPVLHGRLTYLQITEVLEKYRHDPETYSLENLSEEYGVDVEKLHKLVACCSPIRLK